MASVGHIAVGMAAARAYHDGRVPTWSSMAVWSGLSLLPDVDVVGFALGVEYGDPWGHRGATHSLTLSIALGLAIGLAARRFKLPAVRTSLFAGVVLASHGLLDTLTDGGLGSALLWPFDLTRYFAPWQPIPVAPIGLDFFGSYGASVALTELVLFSPLLLLALWSRRVGTIFAGVFLAVWLSAVWLIASSSPNRDALVGYVFGDTTVYASGFSEEVFRAIAPRDPEKEVRNRLGPPLRESWFYTPNGLPAFGPAADRSAAALPPSCVVVRFEAGRVVTALDLDACRAAGIAAGMTPADVERRLGSPSESCAQYTWSPTDAPYRERVVCFHDGKVEMRIRQWRRP